MSSTLPVPPALAEALRLLGPGFNLPQVQALYQPLLADQPRSDVRLLADQAYGSHPRYRADVYLPESPEATPPSDGWPVLVCFHGGGFIRGDKSQRANMGWHFARSGVLTVVPNYRLAPESCWPSGPQDVVAAWSWLRRDIAKLGGNPDAIILLGESAGAAHVAAATLIRRFQPVGWSPAGAVVVSGPYDARLEGMARAQFGIATPDPRNEAYFGAAPGAWKAASIVEHVDAAPLPLLISFAERDLLQMQVQAGALFSRLVSAHAFQPELLMVRDHNHFSQGYSVGTGDDSLAGPVLEFVRRVHEKVTRQVRIDRQS